MQTHTSFFAISFFLLATAAATNPKPFILPQGTGRYYTSLTITEYVDKSRPDPFNSTHMRRIMTSRFDPIPANKCKLTQVEYLPPATAAIENDILADYEFPRILDQFVLQVCKRHDGHRGHAKPKREFPLALFSPGLNTTRLLYSSLAQEIASYGFIVMTIDHPYDIDVVEFPNGDIILGGRVTKPADANGSTVSVEHALDVRAQDVSFLLDTLGVRQGEKVLMFGQSFGGAAVATSMLRDKRIRAGVNLDGIMFGDVLSTPLGNALNNQSFMLWGSEGHNSSSDESWGQFWETLEASPHVDFARELKIADSSHGAAWDLNLVVDIAGIRDELSELARLLVDEAVLGTRVWKILGRYLSSYFWFSLGMKEEDAILKGPNDEFPEVEILRKKKSP